MGPHRSHTESLGGTPSERSRKETPSRVGAEASPRPLVGEGTAERRVSRPNDRSFARRGHASGLRELEGSLSLLGHSVLDRRRLERGLTFFFVDRELHASAVVL